MPPKKIQNYFYATVIVIGLYTLIPFLLLNIYNHPSVDDFEFAIRDNQSNFFAVQSETYHNWSGRYFATALSQINPTRYKAFTNYKIYSTLLLSCFVLSLHLLTSNLLRGGKPVQRLALTALVFVLYIAQMPSVPEGLYWVSSYQTYQIPNIFFLLLLYLLIHLIHSSKKIFKSTITLAMVVISAAIAGSNEIAIIYLMTVLTFVLIQLWRLQHAAFRYILMVFVCTFAASLAMVLAPGNYVRQDLHYAEAGDVIWSTSAAAILIISYFYKWGILLAVASILYAYFWRAPSQDIGLAEVFKVPLWFSLLFYFGTLFLMNFAYNYSVGAVPKPRVENSIYFFFVIGWFYNLQVVMMQYHAQLQKMSLPSILTGMLTLLFVRLVFDISNNISTAYSDILSGKAARYNRELNARYFFLESSACEVCVVEPLSGYPESLFIEDITINNAAEKDLLVNRAYRKFWGKEGVYLAAPNPVITDNNLETFRLIGRRIKHMFLQPSS